MKIIVLLSAMLMGFVVTNALAASSQPDYYACETSEKVDDQVPVADVIFKDAPNDKQLSVVMGYELPVPYQCEEVEEPTLQIDEPTMFIYDCSNSMSGEKVALLLDTAKLNAVLRSKGEFYDMTCELNPVLEGY